MKPPGREGGRAATRDGRDARARVERTKVTVLATAPLALKRFLRDGGVSQRALARRTKIPQTRLSRLIHRTTVVIGLDQARRLAREMGMPITALVLIDRARFATPSSRTARRPDTRRRPPRDTHGDRRMTSREHTADEVRDKLLGQVWLHIRYWMKESRARTAQEKLEGFAFSLLAMLDGSNADIPKFIVAPDPHPTDRRFHEGEGEDFYPSNADVTVACDLGGSLHEMFYKVGRQGALPELDVEEAFVGPARVAACALRRLARLEGPREGGAPRRQRGAALAEAREAAAEALARVRDVTWVRAKGETAEQQRLDVLGVRTTGELLSFWASAWETWADANSSPDRLAQELTALRAAARATVDELDATLGAAEFDPVRSSDLAPVDEEQQRLLARAARAVNALDAALGDGSRRVEVRHSAGQQT